MTMSRFLARPAAKLGAYALVLVAVLAGGALAVAGVAFQGLTRNPLAEPSVLGVTSGAAFGVVLAQILGPVSYTHLTLPTNREV